MKYIGKVYRIFYGDLSYVGSTINLKERMRNHIRKKDCSSKEIICFDDYEVEILAEIYYVENQHDINLRNLEREYMEQYVCINKRRAFLSKEEKKEYQKSDKYKEYHKEYEKSDKRKEYQKKYQKSDKRKDYQKEYRKSDKRKDYQKEYKKSDKYKEYQKEYYLKNKAT